MLTSGEKLISNRGRTLGTKYLVLMLRRSSSNPIWKIRCRIEAKLHRFIGPGEENCSSRQKCGHYARDVVELLQKVEILTIQAESG